MAEGQRALLSVGTLVRGRYALKSVLGSGSTGAVYLVRDQKDQALQSTLLVLKDIYVIEKQKRYEFTIRGTPLYHLQHPALPRIHALFNDDKRGCVSVVMDAIEGERLADIPWGQMTWQTLQVWCEPLVAALNYLHRQEQPFFHGDLKPANLVRNASGKVMLVDLGFVPQVSVGGRVNCYRAPEQFAGVLDERSDVYGCGALLYALLSGEEPLDALTRRERIGKKRADPLVLASKLSAYVPRALAEVLQRALALDPAERFASIKEFWDALSPLAMELEAPLSAAEHQQSSPLPLSELLAVSSPDSSHASGGSGSTPLPVPVVGQTRPRVRVSQRGLLPGIAGISALLLLLLGAGAWVWGALHSGAALAHQPAAQATSTNLPGTPTASEQSPEAGPFTSITGEYKGTYNLYAPNGDLLSQTTLTLVIQQQHEGHFSGTFDSPLQHGQLVGSIDRDNDVLWTVLDAAGNAVFSFTGVLNGISGTRIDTQDSMGGVLSKCQPGRGAQCFVLQGPNNGGLCVLNYVHSAFIAPGPIWA